jgi:hypothetical protein
MSIFSLLPGRSLEDAANRELGQLNDTRTGTKNYNWQDQLGGMFGGYSKEEVVKRAEEIANEELRRKYDNAYARTNTKDRLGELTGNYKGVQGLTIADIMADQASDEQRANQLEAYKQTKGANVALLDPTISSSGIQGATTRLINDELSRLEGKQDARTDKADARIEKQDNLLNRRQDFAESQSQRQTAYNNRVLDMKDARESRNARDKQLMMIIQGLNSFGQGFQ